MIKVRMVKWTDSFQLNHQDVDITDVAFWQPPQGWNVQSISTTDKGMPPWENPSIASDDPDHLDAQVVSEDEPTLAEQVAAEVDPDPRNSRFTAPDAPKIKSRIR